MANAGRGHPQHLLAAVHAHADLGPQALQQGGQHRRVHKGIRREGLQLGALAQGGEPRGQQIGRQGLQLGIGGGGAQGPGERGGQGRYEGHQGSAARRASCC